MGKKKKKSDNFEKGLDSFFDTIQKGIITAKSKIDKIEKKDVEKFFSNAGENAVKLSGGIGAFLSQDALLKHLETLTKSASNQYDKALDSEYLRTKIGGGNHRLFDGGHDIFGAWDKVKEAMPDDNFGQEVLGYMQALWKDISTVKGLPFATTSKESYDSWANTISKIPGVDKKYAYDLLSFDAYEILSTAIGSVGIFLALKKKDQEKLAELLGSMGIISILSANPIMGIFTISSAAFAYKKKQMEFDGSAFGKSAAISATSMALFSILGLPILFELILVTVLTKLFRKSI